MPGWLSVAAAFASELEDPRHPVVLANLGEVERPDAIARGLAEYWLPELRGEPLIPPG